MSLNRGFSRQTDLQDDGTGRLGCACSLLVGAGLIAQRGDGAGGVLRADAWRGGCGYPLLACHDSSRAPDRGADSRVGAAAAGCFRRALILATCLLEDP